MNPETLDFDQAGLMAALAPLDAAALDQVPFGLIGFDADGLIVRYNRWESDAARLRPEQVLTLHVFNNVAQCMNNFQVAQRFDDAQANGEALDVTVDWVLTLRMKPTPVRLRLLAQPGHPIRYVCIERRP